MTNQQTRKLNEARAIRLAAMAGDLARREEDGRLVTEKADSLDLMKLANWGKVGQLRR